MWKRLWKNAILALCMLALVFQPVNIFATSSTYTTISSFVQAANAGITNYQPSSITYFFVDDYSSYTQLFANCVSYFSIDTSKIRYLYLSEFSNGLILDIIVTPEEITYCQANFRSSYCPYLISYTIGSGTGYRYTCSYLSNSYNYYSSTQTPSYAFQPYNNAISGFRGCYPYNILSFLDNNQNVYYLDLDNSGGGSGDDSGSTDLSTIETYLANLYLQNGLLISNNFRSYTPDGTLVNGSWLGVGAFLTYQYNCMQNMNSASVTYINQAGTTITAVNPYYYFYHQLDSIFVDISDIMLAVEDISDDVTFISDINDRLELAFPDDQADMNDHIADTLLNDTNGNGLTISKISSAKSNLDDGLNTFKLDTSQSQYSNPFSALDDADWSFWSQTTLNNLGSGYSYSFSEGSLMSEDDVFTENQNDLLNLLGW